MNGIPAPPNGPVTKLDCATLLTKTAELGEYFALPPGVEDEWQSLPLLFDDAVLGEFVGRTRDAIAVSARCEPSSVPIKVAASSFQLGVAARLLSPVVGAATCFGAVPLLDLRSVRWQSTPKHSPRFAIADVDWVVAPTPSAAAVVISASVLAAIFGPLNETLRSQTSLSPRVTWGNVIAAANGAVTVLSMSQPEHEGYGRALVRALMDTERLADTATFARGTFTRRSCCLFYQAPSSGLCMDCVLTESDRSHRSHRQ